MVAGQGILLLLPPCTSARTDGILAVTFSSELFDQWFFLLPTDMSKGVLHKHRLHVKQHQHASLQHTLTECDAQRGNEDEPTDVIVYLDSV